MSGDRGRPRPSNSSKDRHRQHGCDWSASTRSVQYVRCFRCSRLSCTTFSAPRGSSRRRGESLVDPRGEWLSLDVGHSASHTATFVNRYSSTTSGFTALTRLLASVAHSPMAGIYTYVDDTTSLMHSSRLQLSTAKSKVFWLDLPCRRISDQI